MILDQKTIVRLLAENPVQNNAMPFARAIEAAILAKIGEPVAHQWLDTMHIMEKVPSYAVKNEWAPLYRLPEVKE